MVPTLIPPSIVKKDCAASSIVLIPFERHRATASWQSAEYPQSGRKIAALVFFVMTAAIESIFMLIEWVLRVSTKTGLAPAASIGRIVGIGAMPGTKTSSPALTPLATNAACKAAEPELTATQLSPPKTVDNTSS